MKTKTLAVKLFKTGPLVSPLLMFVLKKLKFL